MATTYTLQEARKDFDELVERAAGGEEIVITDDGQPRARLAPVVRQTRRPGGWEGQVRIADDFDDPLPDDLLARFEGAS